MRSDPSDCRGDLAIVICSCDGLVRGHGHGLWLCLDCHSRGRDHGLGLGLDQRFCRDDLIHPTFDGCRAVWIDVSRSLCVCYRDDILKRKLKVV